MVIVIKAPNIAKTPNKKTIKCLSNSWDYRFAFRSKIC
jgi:hypothetical protein